MAVGNKGSFATVQPNTGVIDVAGMVKGGFEDLSDIQEKDFERKKQVEEAKIGIKDILADPTVAGTGQKTFDEIDYSIVSQMRDMQYDIQKKVQSGEISISEGRAMASNYNKKLSEYTDLRKTLTPTVDSFITDYSEGKISRGLGDDWIGEQGLVTNIVDGKIEEVELDENGNPMYSEKGVNKKMYLKSVVDTINNAPRAYDLQGEAKGLAEEFISRIDVFEGVDRNDKKNYYMTFTQEGLDNNQKELIREKARSIALNPKLQNDLWFQLTGERGKYNFSEDEVQRLSNELQDKMVREVEARTKKSAKEKLGRSDALAGRKYADEQRGEEPSVEIQGTSRTSSLMAQGFDQGVSSNSLKVNSRFDQPITIKTEDGFQTLSNLTLKEIGLNNDNDFIVYGETQITEGAKQKLKQNLDQVSSQLPGMTSKQINDFIKGLADQEDSDLTQQSLLMLQKTIKEEGIYKDGELVKPERLEEITNDLVESYSRVRGVIPRTEIGILSRFGGSEEIRKKLQTNTVQTSSKAAGL